MSISRMPRCGLFVGAGNSTCLHSAVKQAAATQMKF